MSLKGHLCKYKYDASKTVEASTIRNLPNVESTGETETSIIEYFDKNTIDEIEGIYKSYQSEQLGYYKIGIKKYGSKYKAIIIESDLNHWKTGEVKAVFETSSMKGFYSTKWYRGNKTPFETFALMENPALLTVEFKDAKTGEKRTDKFIKMYPSADVSSSVTIDGIKATGSGFVISTDGIIATNAHVIEDADRIEIHLNNEFGTKTYSASILLKDESNDVALLKIDDAEFKGFNSLPYSILQTTEIGEDVFTIGYPLNSLMGDNYKVTNGIISSNSGLKDDVRFIQITTPIQPGNSGGPLFNKDGNVVGLTTSKLNERAVGTSIENVNYAIKAAYLVNIYNMLPNKEQLSKNTTLSDKDLKDQVKVLKNYVCLIKVYKKNTAANN
jgi:S1-C subfamily serine protease